MVVNQLLKWDNLRIYVSSPDGRTSGVLGQLYYPTLLRLTRTFDLMPAQLDMTFEDVDIFQAKFDQKNPLQEGSQIRITHMNDDDTEQSLFSGVVTDFMNIGDGDRQGVNVTAWDKSWALDKAAVNEYDQTRVIFAKEELGFVAGTSFSSTTETYPWAGNYIPLVYSGVVGQTQPDEDGNGGQLPIDDYTYNALAGMITFRTTPLSGGVEPESATIWANYAYYDDTDTSMKISEIFQRGAEYATISGGVGWTENTDFVFEDTPNFVLNQLRWITDEGNGNFGQMYNWIHEEYEWIGLPPSYQIHDFTCSGVVEGKSIVQDSSSAFDVQVVFSYGRPSNMNDAYGRIVLVSNQYIREDLNQKSGTTPGGHTAPTGSVGAGAPFSLGDFGALTNIVDQTNETGHGYLYRAKFSLNDYDNFEKDVPLITMTFAQEEEIDMIVVGARWSYDKDFWDANPVTPGSAGPAEFKQVYTNAQYTVQWSSNASDWFPISSDLWHFSVDPTGGQDSYIVVSNIAQKAQYIRLVVNNPLHLKIGESNLGNADRCIAYHATDFRAYNRGRLLDDTTEKLPEMVFVTDSGSEDRYKQNLAGDTIDMYRPRFMDKLASLIPFRTLVFENDHVWTVSGTGSIGQQTMATWLDYYSNMWDTVEVEIEPDARIYLGDTVRAPAINPNKYYTVIHQVIQFENTNPSMRMRCVDYDAFHSGE